MAAKKKKSTTKPYGNKTKFVLGLSRDLSAKEVVSEAKKNGITITEAHVYKIRSTAKAKGGSSSTRGSKSAVKSARGASKTTASKRGRPAGSGRKTSTRGGKAGAAGLSKREFVMSFGSDTPASEILRKAKEAGVGLSKAYLYTIRSSESGSGKRGAGGRKAAGRGQSANNKSNNKAALKGLRGKVETQFVEAALDLGLSKATELLSRLRKSY